MEKIQNAKVKWMAELFLTDLNNIFAERETDRFDDAGNTIIERHNSSGAMVKGITAETEINLSKKLDIEIGFTFQNSEYDVPETWSDDAPSEKKMFRTPDTYGFAMIEYTPIVPLTISFNNTYTGKMLMQHFESGDNEKDKSVETSDFWDCGLSCKYSIPIHCVKMNVGIGVRNIFNAFQKDLDKGSERDGAYIYGPASPRNYYFEISFHL